MVRKDYDYIGLFFDTRALQRDKSFVINRIWVDSPKGAETSASNLHSLIRHAYGEELKRGIGALKKPF
jgi:hypothetical protein